MKLKEIINIGVKNYDCHRWINYRCVLVFTVRCFLHRKSVNRLCEFLGETDLRRQYIERHPKVFAQLTRQWLFRDSCTHKRLEAVLY